MHLRHPRERGDPFLSLKLELVYYCLMEFFNLPRILLCHFFKKVAQKLASRWKSWLNFRLHSLNHQIAVAHGWFAYGRSFPPKISTIFSNARGDAKCGIQMHDANAGAEYEFKYKILSRWKFAAAVVLAVKILSGTKFHGFQKAVSFFPITGQEFNVLDFS